jgi:hypothetical protein
VANKSGQLISGCAMQSLTPLAWQVVEGTVTLREPVDFDNMDAAIRAVEKDYRVLEKCEGARYVGAVENTTVRFLRFR